MPDKKSGLEVRVGRAEEDITDLKENKVDRREFEPVRWFYILLATALILAALTTIFTHSGLSVSSDSLKP